MYSARESSGAAASTASYPRAAFSFSPAAYAASASAVRARGLASVPACAVCWASAAELLARHVATTAMIPRRRATSVDVAMAASALRREAWRPISRLFTDVVRVAPRREHSQQLYRRPYQRERPEGQNERTHFHHVPGGDARKHRRRRHRRGQSREEEAKALASDPHRRDDA